MPPKNPRFKTGAIPTPRHLLAAAPKFVPQEVKAQRPIVVPTHLSFWDNNQDGDCVTAEEAAAVAMYSVMQGGTEVFVPDAEVIRFCNAFGFLNGAGLTEVMDKMMSDGFIAPSPLHNGPHATVDFATEATLQSALEVGPVKIGIDSSALPGGAGNANGWSAFGGSPGQFTNEDHCVGLFNYGSVAALCQALGVPVPAGAPANGYHLFTWNTIGVVDHAWIMSTVGEAWVRNPTVREITPGPGPGPGPGPQPSMLCTILAAEYAQAQAQLAGRPILLALLSWGYTWVASAMGCTVSKAGYRIPGLADVSPSTLQQELDAAMDAAIATAGPGTLASIILQSIKAYLDNLLASQVS